MPKNLTPMFAAMKSGSLPDEATLLLRKGTTKVMQDANRAIDALQTTPNSELLVQIKGVVEQLKELDRLAVSRTRDQARVDTLVTSIQTKIEALDIPNKQPQDILDTSPESKRSVRNNLLGDALTGMQESVKYLKAEAHTRQLHTTGGTTPAPRTPRI